MKSTFELSGTMSGGGETKGTVFIVGKPVVPNSRSALSVLVTAAHVLNSVSDDYATISLHVQGADGSYTSAPFKIKIRDHGQNLYVTHPEADVAAMYVPLPSMGFDILPIEALVTDQQIVELELHPGDELLCLGFPGGMSLNSFPVIRSGVLASYPLTPSKAIKEYYYNFHVFSGNSGGPVYFSYPTRVIGGNLESKPSSGGFQGIIGLVSKQAPPSKLGFGDAVLDISIVVPSSLIIDTVNLLRQAPTGAGNSNIFDR